MLEFIDNIKVTHGCETKATHPTQGRKSCHTSDKPDIVTAPEGYLIDDRDVKTEELVRRGDCDYQTLFSDWVEIAPNIKYPKTLTITAHSRSPKTNGATGHIQIRVTGTFINVPEFIDKLKFWTKDMIN